MGLMYMPTRGIGTVSNLASSVGTYSNRGTNVAAPVSTNTKGSWVELISAANVTGPVIGFTAQIANNLGAGAARRCLHDIGIGGAGSEVVIVSNLGTTGPNNPATQPAARELFFPIRIPQGTRIACRSQSNNASQTSNVVITLFYGNWLDYQTYSGAEVIGADTSTTSMLAHTAGNSSAYSSWTNIGSPTTRPYYGGALYVMNDTLTTLTALNYVAQFGYNSNPEGETWFAATTNESQGSFLNSTFTPGKIPTGTQLQIRAKCSATGESLQYGVICLY